MTIYGGSENAFVLYLFGSSQKLLSTSLDNILFIVSFLNEISLSLTLFILIVLEFSLFFILFIFV